MHIIAISYRELCSIGRGYKLTVSCKSSDTLAAISSSLLDVICSEPFWLKAVAASCSSVSRSSREMNNEAHTCTIIKAQCFFNKNIDR